MLIVGLKSQNRNITVITESREVYKKTSYLKQKIPGPGKGLQYKIQSRKNSWRILFPDSETG